MQHDRTRALILTAGIAALGAAPQNTPTSPPKAGEVQKVRENLYVLSGGGGNAVVFVTDLGVVLVDTKLAGQGQALADKIKAITPKAVATIINTHSHVDHTGSNEFFPLSVEIVAQENTRLNMEKLDAYKGDKINYLPKLMFKEKMSLGSGKDKVDLYFFGPGHTGGDAWVVFPALRAAYIGDMMGARELPSVDLANGGSVLQYSDTLAKGLSVLKNVDTIITGHGPVVTVKDFAEYVQFNRDFRDAVVSGYNHGFGFTELADAWRVPDKYRGYEAPPDRVKASVQAIFGELGRSAPATP